MSPLAVDWANNSATLADGIVVAAAADAEHVVVAPRCTLHVCELFYRWHGSYEKNKDRVPSKKKRTK